MLVPVNELVAKERGKETSNAAQYALNIKVSNLDELKYITLHLIGKPDKLKKKKKIDKKSITVSNCEYSNPNYNDFIKEVYDLPKTVWNEFKKLTYDLGLDPKLKNKIDGIDVTYFIHEVPYGVRMEMMTIFGCVNSNKKIAQQWNSVNASAYNVYYGVDNKMMVENLRLPVIDATSSEILNKKLHYGCFNIYDIGIIKANIVSPKEKDEFIKIK